MILSSAIMAAMKHQKVQPKRPPNSRGQGRKPLQEGVQTVTVGVRMLPEQKEKLKQLGGNEWLRKKIDSAKMKKSSD